MTKREPKAKLDIPTRAPRAKGDMFQNLRRPEQVEALEHDELIPPLDPPKVALDHPSPPEVAQGGLRPPKGETVAPVRDFNKRANVLDRDALPSGIFPGSSKKLYDALYIRTLGAVAPSKTIQATRRELGAWSGIRNVKTIAAHLRHLETVGLVMRGWDRGDNEGSVYEVRLPAGLRPPKTTQGSLGPPEVALDQISDLPLDQISALGGLSQAVDSQRANEPSKTSFKTNTEKLDDEAMPLLRARIGKAPKTEAVLLSLLDQLEARTDVSSPDSLLAHVLRRKLTHKPNATQPRPSDEQFRPGPVAEFSEDELADLRAEAERNRAELEGKG